MRRCSDDEPFAGLAFKIMTDPFVGSLTFVRIYSGVVDDRQPGAEQRQGQPRAGRPHAADARQPPRGHQGSARRRHRRVGRAQEHDDRRHAVRSRRIRSCSSGWSFRSRSSRSRSSPRPRATRKRWARRWPGSRPRTRHSGSTVDHESGQTVIKGMGELHLEIIVDRMKREFKVDANVGAPQVAYRETITRTVRGRLHAQEADRRRRPVRPRQDALRAVAAGLRLCLRERGGRRHRAEGIRARRREGAARPRPRPACSPASRSST